MVQKTGGFTIIELLIVLALVAIIATFAVPQFGRIIDNNRVVSTTNSIVGLLSFSRSEAIRRGARVSTVALNDQVTANLTSDNSLIRTIEAPAGSIDITDNTVTFRSNGLTTSGANITFNVCTNSPDGRLITVTPGGRVETTEVNCP